VIGPITHIIASIQVAEAIKLMVEPARREFELVTYDVWTHRFQRLVPDSEAMKTCPVCAESRYDYLEGEPLRTITLCGRNAVQLIPSINELDFQSCQFDRRFRNIPQRFLEWSSPPLSSPFQDGPSSSKRKMGLARSFTVRLWAHDPPIDLHDGGV
jgi:hypothetical protein